MATAVDDTRKAAVQRSRLATVVSDHGRVTIPGWVTDLDSFRRWLDTADVPEKAKTWFFRGEGWVDMSKEQLYSYT